MAILEKSLQQLYLEMGEHQPKKKGDIVRSEICKWSTPVSNPSNLICSYHKKQTVIELETKLAATQKILQRLRDKQNDEAVLRKLQILKAEAELKLLQEKK